MSQDSEQTSIPPFYRLAQAPREILNALSFAPLLAIALRRQGVSISYTGSPAAALLAGPSDLWLPSLGLRLDPRRIHSIHVPQEKMAPRVEIDFQLGTHRLDITIPAGRGGPDLLAPVIARYATGETDARQLAIARGELRPPFEMCPCCREHAERRRAHPEKHPLLHIFSAAAEAGIRFHLDFRGVCWSLAGFFLPAAVIHEEGCLIIRDANLATLRIDLAYAHCLMITPMRIDGELRAALQVSDMLGEPLFTLTSAHTEQLHAWRKLCQAYFG